MISGKMKNSYLGKLSSKSYALSNIDLLLFREVPEGRNVGADYDEAMEDDNDVYENQDERNASDEESGEDLMENLEQ